MLWSFLSHPTCSLHPGILGEEGEPLPGRRACRARVRGEQGWDRVLWPQEWPSPATPTLQPHFPLRASFLIMELPIIAPSRLGPSWHLLFPWPHISSVTKSCRKDSRMCFLHPTLLTFSLTHIPLLSFSILQYGIVLTLMTAFVKLFS